MLSGGRYVCQPSPMGHPTRIPVWLPWEQRVIYFVTICVAHRQPVLANERAFRAFKAAVGKLQHWTVLAAVLMHRPSARHRFANRCSRRQAGEFFGSTETLDSPRTKRGVEMAAGLF